MKRSTSFISPQQRFQSTRAPGKTPSRVTGVTDFLRMHDKMASLLPAVQRLVTLQEECQATLPALFDRCSVLQFEDGQLVLAAPNAALATKLRQQLPKLQESLLQRGWQVNALRIKVQVGKISEKKVQAKQLTLPTEAKSALASLRESLDDGPQNQALRAAIGALLRRHQQES